MDRPVKFPRRRHDNSCDSSFVAIREYAVPAFLILCVLLHVALVVHAIQRHRADGWLLLILMLPGVGTLLYVLLMAWERLLAVARVPTPTASEPVHPERELGLRRAALAVSDNLLNRLALALACLKHGRYEEAADMFERLDAGECRNDPLILLGLARCQFALERFQAAKGSLDRLIAENPNFRSEAGHLLYARSLEALGEVQDALHEYEVLTSYSRTPEALCRHAMLLTHLGRPGEARDLYRSLLETLRRAPRNYARIHHQWFVLAEREVAALAL